MFVHFETEVFPGLAGRDGPVAGLDLGGSARLAQGRRTLRGLPREEQAAHVRTTRRIPRQEGQQGVHALAQRHEHADAHSKGQRQVTTGC